MLLSDQDILYAIGTGELVVDPMGTGCLQPSSVDVRLDRLFRTFRRTKWTHIDPAIEQDGLTELIEVPEGEPFILHPGEFVLGSTMSAEHWAKTGKRGCDWCAFGLFRGPDVVVLSDGKEVYSFKMAEVEMTAEITEEEPSGT